MPGFVPQILNTEKKADEILKNAEREHVKAVAQAREKALRIAADKKKEAELRSDDEIKHRMKQIDARRNEIIIKYRKAASTIEQQAGRNMGAAASFIVKKIVAGE